MPTELGVSAIARICRPGRLDHVISEISLPDRDDRRVGHELDENRMFDRDSPDPLCLRLNRSRARLASEMLLQHCLCFVGFFGSDYRGYYRETPFVHFGNDVRD